MEDKSQEISARSVAALVLGVAGFSACPVLGSIAAVILGIGEKNAVGRAGFWLGWIGLGLTLLLVVLSLLFVVFVVWGSIFFQELV
jgi:hypothetical protein